MKTVLFALALAMPIGAQTLDYATLCGDATEGTGDNNDFCHLWAQGNHQGMRHALSIAIRTARAAENRNRFYFDHRTGSPRGAFIQIRRPWMGDDWQIRRNMKYGNISSYLIENQSRHKATAGRDWSDAGVISLEIVTYAQAFTLTASDILRRATVPAENGFSTVRVGYHELRRSGCENETTPCLREWATGLDMGERLILGGFEYIPLTSEQVRVFTECALDEYAWRWGLVQERPTIGDGYCPPESREY